ncbi:hypothetical protein [Corynebacterium sp.]
MVGSAEDVVAGAGGAVGAGLCTTSVASADSAFREWPGLSPGFVADNAA